jgi:excisionase family DNA binding protein
MGIEPDRLYLVAEVAGILRCGKTNVYDLLNEGSLARTAIGAGNKGMRVRGSDLLAFLDARREGGPIARGSFKYLKPGRRAMS